MRRQTLLKIAAGVAALGILIPLFIRSAMNVSAEPYTMTNATGRWTMAVTAEPEASGIVLELRPPEGLVAPLFSQVFRRSGLSLSGPSPSAMPLILKREYDLEMGGILAAEALATLARDSGVETTPPTPLCMAARRVSQPGSTREVFFVRVAHPPFEAFRRSVAARLAERLGSAVRFDPAGLTPAMIIAATDANFASWLPLQGAPTADCLAPIVASTN